VIRLTLTCLLLISVPAFAQRPGGTLEYYWGNKLFTGNDEVPPKVIIHDFGTLAKGTEKTYTFKMTNIYAIPVQIAEPKPNCGCISVVTWTGKMESAQTGIIEVKIDTKRVEGVKQVSLPVYITGVHPKTGEVFNSKAELELRAVIRADTTIAPGSFSFGVVPSGSTPSQTLNLAYNGQLPGWRLTEYHYNKSLFDITIAPVAVRAGVSYQIKATVKKDAAVGSFASEEVLLKTNDPANPVININIAGKIQSPLSTYPEIVRMDKTSVGKSVEKNVLVQADKLFKIATIDGTGDGIDAEFRMGAPAAKTHVIKVTFNPTKAGLVKKNLVIKTEEGETVNLPIEAPTVE
jgi:hypothetical protein